MVKKLANNLLPAILIIVAVVLLAFWIVCDSNRNQRSVIEAVKQAVKDREAAERMESPVRPSGTRSPSS
jgi:CHASE3 domain sensor protein